ncbi:MAG: N-acetylmuramoyl-L-alanine amidase [Rhabdochlamydiaceae bacterium]|nr:N-acetylmuramoyl-L-alanine amidase [Rhabdochlamydiaceae bacterium]
MRSIRALYLVFILVLCVLVSGSGKRPSTNAYTSASYGESSREEIDPKVLAPLIILDPGHGGTDHGAAVRSFQEKKVTLLATLLTKKHLEELGYRVLLTRSRDAYLSLPRRVSIANKASGVLFVSIHFNSAKNTDAHGIEVFYYGSSEPWRSRASQRLANCILYRVIDQTTAHSRGVKHGNFHVIRETEMPAVLVEGGFITNAHERDRLKSRDYLNRMAIGIAQGVDKYLKT